MNFRLISSFPTRRHYLALAIGFICFAIYASVIPFELRDRSFTDAVGAFGRALSGWPRRVSRSDILANILLFVPVGFTMMGAWLVDRERRAATTMRAAAVVLPVSILASTTAEFMQTLMRERMSTWVDIASQTIGCTVGMAAWTVLGPAATAWIRRTLAAAPDARLPRVLAAYVFLWLFINLAPFDVTVDVGDLGRRLRTGKVGLVPVYETGSASSRLVWDALAEVLGAVPLGAAALLGWPMGSRRSPAAAWAVGAILVVLTECAQIFISSHAAIGSDALFGSVGVAAGVWIASVFAKSSSLGVTPRSTAFPLRPALVGMLAWCVVLGLYHWQPYNFSLDGEMIRDKLNRISLIPFSAYLRGRWLNALNDILTKLSLSAPLGIIAAFVARARGQPSRAMIVCWAFLFAGVFAAVEFGQFFLATRVPDPTDVMIGTVGAVAGLLIGYWLFPPRSTQEKRPDRMSDRKLA